MLMEIVREAAADRESGMKIFITSNVIRTSSGTETSPGEESKIFTLKASAVKLS